jgi:hypothetical protein
MSCETAAESRIIGQDRKRNSAVEMDHAHPGSGQSYDDCHRSQ